ncbi:hypothetical protein DEU56DRAFT_251652 [Suillus clintonianus]|uniref:uncharacterized protein n=1 Tax=Suillus clintonianus TaxID=1904413 RepID=UPI001B872869|nr:uncharacterized protein DEU56DRAFT_251652 [Suillus clintonianus]KAG2142971.1 hypothetical protein DEU56DRAFT_251652 [Suillus clintonianus]
MVQLRKDMEAAIRDKDLETKEELKEEIRSKHYQILKLQGEKDRLEAEFKAAKERLEARISAMEEKHREQGTAGDGEKREGKTGRRTGTEGTTVTSPGGGQCQSSGNGAP